MEPAAALDPMDALDPAELPEREYPTGEVLLVSADIEERESTYVAPEFEPVSEVDRSFAAAIDLELVTEEIVHLPVREASQPPARSTGVHVFAEASGPASFDPTPAVAPAEAADQDDDADGDADADAADDDDDADGDASAAAGDADPDANVAAGAGQQPAAELGAGASGDPTRPRRRRRRRGGRGRGKPPDIRQNSE